MKPQSLCGCYAQTKWAETAIDKLQADIEEFVATDPYEFTPHLNIEAGEEVWRFKINGRLPASMFIDVRNVLGNLRDPLDNILAILSERKRGRSDGVGFPFGNIIETYRSDLKKVEKLLPDGAGDLIRKAETHPGGNVHLRALHDLNIHKKHRVPIAPFNLSTSTTAQALAVFKGGRLIRVGFKNGTRLTPILSGLPGAGTKLVPSIPPPKFIPDQGFVFEPAPGDDDMEVLAVTPGTEFQAHFKPALSVAFTNTPGLEREPICIALHQMRHLVEGILVTFEKRFF